MRHQCILHCPLDTAHHRDEPTSAPHPLEPHRVPHPNPPWGRDDDDDGDVGDGELIHMYYVVGPCTSWPRALSLTLARALSAAGRQAGNSLCLCPPRCSLLSSASFGLYIQWQAIRYAHFLYKYIRVCVCVFVCIHIPIYVRVCLFVSLCAKLRLVLIIFSFY